MAKPNGKEKANKKKTKKSTAPETFTEEITEILDEIIEEKEEKKSEKGEPVTWIEDSTTHFLIGDRKYCLVHNYREGFQLEKIGERFSDILNRYDYIVGDWGYEQLRLKGFFKEENKGVPVEQRITALQDYLYEFCNFGCAYFVIERIGGGQPQSTNQNRNNKRKNTKKPNAHTQEKKGIVPSKQNLKKQHVIKKRTEEMKSNDKKSNPVKNKSKTQEKRNFTIRKKDKQI